MARLHGEAPRSTASRHWEQTVLLLTPRSGVLWRLRRVAVPFMAWSENAWFLIFQPFRHKFQHLNVIQQQFLNNLFLGETMFAHRVYSA